MAYLTVVAWPEPPQPAWVEGLLYGPVPAAVEEPIPWRQVPGPRSLPDWTAFQAQRLSKYDQSTAPVVEDIPAGSAAAVLAAVTHLRQPWLRQPQQPTIIEQPAEEAPPLDLFLSGAWPEPEPEFSWVEGLLYGPVPVTPVGEDADPLYLNLKAWRGAAYWDRKLVPPQQPPRISPPGLLETALLEISPTDTVRQTAVTHQRLPWLRQEPVQADQSTQPAAVDFDPTQAGYGWIARLAPATHVDRREVPTQRPGIQQADKTTIVGTGAIGGWWSAEDWTAHQYGQFRHYMAPTTAPIDADPTMLAWLPLWLTHNRAATHTDRREVPQQRPYISDPSFYPTVPPTDPLMLAWGVGGHYWLLYNHAAKYGDRRLVPQQRERESVPGMLATALLEDPLLGGFDDLARHRAWHASRRLVPQQRIALQEPPALADPLLISGGDWRRKYTPTTHYQRWVLRTWRQALEYVGSPQPEYAPAFVGIDAASSPVLVDAGSRGGIVEAATSPVGQPS